MSILKLQKSLGSASAMIETDRLLELIDQFAAAEGRMKWAPNKKLHFEVAVIKAIQTLNQVTLNEVIERLSQLRDGKSVSQKQSPPVVGRCTAGTSANSEPTRSATTAAAVSDSENISRSNNCAPRGPKPHLTRMRTAAKDSRLSFLRKKSFGARAVAHGVGIDLQKFKLGFAPDDKAMNWISWVP